jgi:hypothetical protein
VELPEEAPDDVPEAEPLPLAVPVVPVPVVPVPVVPVPVVPPVALPEVTVLPVPPAAPLFDTGTPDVSPDAEPVVDEPAATLPLLTFPVDVEHADSATTPAIPTDALRYFMVIFALCLKNGNGFPA